MKAIVLTLCFFLLCTTAVLGATVANVGSLSITEQDITFRMATERAYGNRNMSRSSALVSLVSEALEQNIAIEKNVTASEAELSAFGTQAEASSLAPQILTKVKSVFSSDTQSYTRLYLSPKVTKKKLKQLFDSSSTIHDSERLTAETVLSQIEGGKTFSAAAVDFGAAHDVFTVAPGAPQQLIDVLSTLSDGQIHQNAFEDEMSFRVLRLVQKVGHTYNAEAVTIAKKSFAAWLQTEASSFGIAILDDELSAEILSKYSTVWWTSLIE